MTARCAFFGASGQGKSTLVKASPYLAAPRRLIFDPMDEYRAHAESVGSLAALLGRVRSESSFALRYVPPRGTERETVARFEALCAIAYDARDLVLVVEELQLVTKPSWSAPAWSECTLRGRHRGLSLVGLSQRPASVDKNFLANCNVVTTFRLNFDDDVATLSKLLGVERERVAGLKKYAFLMRDMDTGAVTPGRTQKKSRRPSRSP